MKDRPILFSTPMVAALLAGTKTQTRRALKVQPLDILPMKGEKAGREWIGLMQKPPEAKGVMFRCKFGVPGDRLWVRENGWERPERTQKMMREGADTWAPYYFDADGYGQADAEQFKEWGFKRRPSIHMPRWASRILLEITDIRVERLNEISDGDCMAEGIQRVPVGKLITFTIPGTDVEKLGARAAYEALWVSINGRESWGANPFIWVVEFQRVTP